MRALEVGGICKNIGIKCDYIIKPGTKHKIQGLGFSRHNSVGNLIIQFDIVFPEKLDGQNLMISWKED